LFPLRAKPHPCQLNPTPSAPHPKAAAAPPLRAHPRRGAVFCYIRIMTETTQTNTAGKDTAKAGGQLLVELGPIVTLVAGYNIVKRLPADHAVFATFGGGPADAIYYATAIFMAATFAAIAYTFWRDRKVPPMLMVMGVIVLAFGALTFAFRDPTFIKIKPSIVNGFFALAIFGSLAIGQNVWRLMFRHLFTLPDKVWNTLAMRWGLFFIAMAIFNIVIWQNFSEDFWVNTRPIFSFGLTFLFMAANLPITLKWMGRDNDDYAAGRVNQKGEALG
jgi:intracellular septation protein